MVQLLPMNSWKEIGPLEESVWKSGAVDPRRRLEEVDGQYTDDLVFS